ncbi:hypothetical protein E2C01_024494 [Portunus trituberculatus]|uniref:Uncharacterized protein n=1 Tax=Portunus trituberculatus TaxID=210409 RepID=A0A5B7EAG6_PORTR|nr:hypothetical protein [Portunus trituberculatus]
MRLLEWVFAIPQHHRLGESAHREGGAGRSLRQLSRCEARCGSALSAVRKATLTRDDLEMIREASSVNPSPHNSIGTLSRSGQTRTTAAGQPLSEMMVK